MATVQQRLVPNYKVKQYICDGWKQTGKFFQNSEYLEKEISVETSKTEPTEQLKQGRGRRKKQ